MLKAEASLMPFGSSKRLDEHAFQLTAYLLEQRKLLSVISMLIKI